MFRNQLFCIVTGIALWAFHIYLLPQEADIVIGKKRIGLCVMATGSYIKYVQCLLDSADIFFMPQHDVTYFVFTDSSFSHTKAKTIYQKQMGWPYDSMMRFEVYHKHNDLFADLDYIYAIDADMLFVQEVAEEIFSERVATIAPGHIFDASKPYEANPLSTAFVHAYEGKHYFAGAFYGGTKNDFMHLVKTASERIKIDLARGYIAWANDESHLNRYFIDYKPTKMLSPSYCHFEHWCSPYLKKIVALDDKNYTIIRKPTHLNPSEYFMQMLKQTAA